MTTDHALWSDDISRSLTTDSTLLFLRVHTASDGVPRGLNLTVRNARTLARALDAACEHIEQRFTHRCPCGEPIDDADAQCVSCELRQRKTLRAMMRRPLDAHQAEGTI